MIAETQTIIAISSKIVDVAQSLFRRKIESEAKKELNIIVDSVLSLKFDTLALQEKYTAIQNERDEWKKKAQDREKNLMNLARYERKEIATGVFVRALKPSEKGSEVEHWLCDNCYTDERESTLQWGSASIEGIHYICHRCKAEIIDHSKAPDLQDFAQ